MFFSLSYFYSTMKCVVQVALGNLSEAIPCNKERLLCWFVRRANLFGFISRGGFIYNTLREQLQLYYYSLSAELYCSEELLV